MGKRKLSDQQRTTVRQDIAKQIKSGKKQSEILEVIAKKYRITPISARWYFQQVRGVQAANGKTRKTQRKPQARSKAISTKRRKSNGARGRAIGAGMTGPLQAISEIQSAAQKTLKRALKARKLIPQWQVFLRKELSLRKLGSTLEKQLRKVTQKAKSLRRRIDQLTSN